MIKKSDLKVGEVVYWKQPDDYEHARYKYYSYSGMYYVNKIKKNEIELLSKVRPLVPGGSRNPQWTIKVPNGDNLYRLNCCPECDKQIELSVYSFTPDYTRSLTVKYRVQCTNDGCIKRAGKKNQFSLATEQCDTLEEALDDWNNGDYYHRTIPPPRSGGRWTGD